MNETSPSAIAELIGHQLRQFDYDLVDVVPVAQRPVGTVGNDALDVEEYLIQIKPRKKAAPQPLKASQETHDSYQIYHPDGTLNVAFLMRNAELLVGCGEYGLARNIYLRIAQAGDSASSTSRALCSLGACHESEGNAEEARSRYEQSIAFQPALETYEKLANLLIRQKKDKPAAECLERALSLKDLPKQTRYQLLKSAGNAWMRASEVAAAERAFKKALDVDPSADEIQAVLGTLYLQAGKIVEAKRKFHDTIASNSTNDQALYGLGMCHLHEGQKREAHDLFARALEINLTNQQAVYQLVKCAYELKTFATAARVVENHIQVAPVNINLLYSLAGLQFHLGRMDDATATVNQMLQLNPNHTGAKDLLRRIENLTCHGGQAPNGH